MFVSYVLDLSELAYTIHEARFKDPDIGLSTGLLWFHHLPSTASPLRTDGRDIVPAYTNQVRLRSSSIFSLRRFSTLAT